MSRQTLAKALLLKSSRTGHGAASSDAAAHRPMIELRSWPSCNLGSTTIWCFKSVETQSSLYSDTSLAELVTKGRPVTPL